MAYRTHWPCPGGDSFPGMIVRQRRPVTVGVVAVAFAAVTTPFASSLHIAAPGPVADRAGLAYSLTLNWTALPGANAYRVLVWTDAAGSWYRLAHTSKTSATVHAYRSGCTEFVVVATTRSGPYEAALDTSNAVRFPLSTNQSLCRDSQDPTRNSSGNND